jgi:hypothetical protein
MSKGLCAAAVLALLAVGALQRTSLAFTPGVPPAAPAVTLAPGHRVCQTPLAVPPGGGFDAVELWPTSPQPLAVEVLDSSSHRRLASVDVRSARAAIPSVPDGAVVDVCVRNRGDREVALLGNGDAAARTSTALLDGNPTGTDIALIFRRDPRPVLFALGDAAQRAALFKFGWTGAWTFWLLGLLVLVAVPLLLVRAVRAATP